MAPATFEDVVVFDDKVLVPLNETIPPHDVWQTLNRTTRHWDTSHLELKLRAQPTKGTEVPWEPGLPGFVA